MLRDQKIRCPICKNENTISLFSSSIQPVNENVLFNKQNKALKSKYGEVKVKYCENCNFGFNSTFNIKLVDYGKNYRYTLPPTPTHRNLQKKVIKIALSKFNIKNKKIIEIGCGKGDFLKELCERGKNEGLGFDTSYTGRKVYKSPNINFYSTFFNSKKFPVKSDFVFARQVLEHLPNPLILLKEMVSILKDKKSTLYIEVPNLNWILDQTTIWDFYYEHCSYLSVDFFKNELLKLGLKNIHVYELYKGQYIGIFANHKNTKLTKKFTTDITSKKIKKFKHKSDIKINNLSNFCSEMTNRGAWAAWGAAAKGITFTNLFNKNLDSQFFLIDINSIRQNKYVPCTGHKIVSPKLVKKMKPHTILVMNGIYFNEIKKYLKENKIKSKLINLEKIS